MMSLRYTLACLLEGVVLVAALCAFAWMLLDSVDQEAMRQAARRQGPETARLYSLQLDQPALLLDARMQP